MKMNKYLTLSLLAAGLSVSAAGFAADNAAPKHGPGSQAVFNKLDANGDGKLTAAEMTRLPQVIKQQMLDKVDTNHNGKIEKSEFEARAKARADRLFAKLDRNGDGSISADEMKSPGRHPMGPPKGDSSGKSGDRDHHRWSHDRDHHRHHDKPSTDEIFAHMDANNDGYVSADEWNHAARHWHRHHDQRMPKPGLDQGPEQSNSD
ncbi:MAG: EF-hand domain-containing protein [Salinisphaera sp.]|uniref:EF-hand domain-containing protein n=1 Tax=Salinisphaera sp. TaxID=1914330 RepID=UPI003C797551